MTEKVLEAIELAKIDFEPLEKNGQNNFFKTQNIFDTLLLTFCLDGDQVELRN